MSKVSCALFTLLALTTSLAACTQRVASKPGVAQTSRSSGGRGGGPRGDGRPDARGAYTGGANMPGAYGVPGSAGTPTGIGGF